MAVLDPILGGLYTLVFGFMVMGGGIVVNLCQILSLVVLPFSHDRFRRINNWLGSAFMKSGAYLLEDWGGSRVVTFGDTVPSGVNALCVVNHSSDLDWAVGISYFSRRGDPFPGAAKAIAKDSIKYIPVYGWIFYFLEYFFVKRSWEKDQISLSRRAKSLSSSSQPYWVVLFPEGTRKTAKKLQQSRQYCESRGLPVFDNVLFPRFKAFTCITEQMRDSLDGICDATISFDEGPLTMGKAMSRRCHGKVRILVKWYPMSELPRGEKELEEWLTKLWTEKDRRLTEIKADRERFFQKQQPHTFPEEPVVFTRMFGIALAWVVLSSATLVLMVTNRTVFRVVLWASGLFWIGVALALAYTMPPSKVGAAKPPAVVPPNNVKKTS